MAARHSSSAGEAEAAAALLDDLGQGADPADDGGRPVAHGLGRGQAEGLVTEGGDEHGHRLAVDLGQGAGVHLGQETHVGQAAGLVAQRRLRTAPPPTISRSASR